jgi:4-hydroxy-tetrahydrodipicolinate synthase
MTQKRLIFTGSATAMVTPFAQDGLNLKTLDRLVDYQLAGGTDALVVCGTTGEPSTMDISEEAVVISRTVERVAGRIPVIVGAGSNDTAFAVKSAKQASNLGADALLMVTPYYNKTTQQGLVRHFNAIADATDLPIILYNIPGRTGINIAPATLRELAKHENIVGVKEASGNIEHIAEIACTCPDLALYSGNDDQVVPILSLGGKGVISVVSNILPQKTHDMVKLFLDGDLAGSRAIQFELLPLIKALFCEVNPIPVKTALNDMGFDCGPLRLPLIEMQEENHARLRAEMQKMGLL